MKWSWFDWLRCCQLCVFVQSPLRLAAKGWVLFWHLLSLQKENRDLEQITRLLRLCQSWTRKKGKKVILKVFFFIGSQLIKCMYFHNTNLPALTFQMFSTERSIEHWSGFWWLLVLLLWDSDTYLCQIPLELSHLIDKGSWCLRLHLKADLSVLYSAEERRPRLYLKIWHLAGGKVSPRPILRLAEACPAQRLKVQNAFKSHF